MTDEPIIFDPIASSVELHLQLAAALRKRGLVVDMVWHGTSGVISVFGPGGWRKNTDTICDIHPTQHMAWFVEWMDGKTMNGKGGKRAFADVLAKEIEARMKWVS